MKESCFWVICCRLFGKSAVGCIFSHAVPAGAPLNVSGTSITSTGVRLSWNPPELHHRNGEIVLYEIMYHQELNFVDDWTTNTTDTWIVIEGLTPGTGYLFQTRAYTSRGSGPWSSPLEIFTLGQGQSAIAVANVRICN